MLTRTETEELARKVSMLQQRAGEALAAAQIYFLSPDVVVCEFPRGSEWSIDYCSYFHERVLYKVESECGRGFVFVRQETLARQSVELQCFFYAREKTALESGAQEWDARAAFG